MLLFLIETGVQAVVVVAGADVVSNAQDTLVCSLRREVRQLPAIGGRSSIGRIAQVVRTSAS